MAEATKEKKPSRIAKFFRDYKSELKKITWCPFKSVKSNTVLVVGLVVALAIVIGLLDLAFGTGFVAFGKLFG
ncbi:MAG: preprotein translocase subunit SecE [Clostridia bacterium]|nr:preprotein translocase subunit SecE [Clostridia bacterium]